MRQALKSRNAKTEPAGTWKKRNRKRDPEMENITVKEIVAATGGRLLCGNETQKIAHLSIDSRTMKGNDLFVPLIGKRWMRIVL